MNPADVVSAVTETLRESLERAFEVHPMDGVAVKFGRPLDASSSGGAGVFLHLFQMLPNPAFRNVNEPTRSQNGELRRDKLLVLDLRYMIACRGDENALEPQRMLAVVAAHLHLWPALSPERLRQAVAQLHQNAHRDAELVTSSAAFAEPVRCIPLEMPLENQSTLQSVSGQPNHLPSLFYTVGPVILDLIDAPVAPRAGRVNLHLQTFTGPPRLIGVSDPVLTVGQPFRVQFAGQVKGPLELRLVYADRQELSIAKFSNSTTGWLEATITDRAFSGVASLKLIDEPNASARQSNLLPMLVAPSVRATRSSVRRGTSITLSVEPRLAQAQAHAVLLNRTRLTSRVSAQGSQIEADIPREFPAGEYSVNVQVDHVWSPPERSAMVRIEG